MAGVATVQANNLRLIFFKGIIASHIITIISIHIAIAFVLAHTFIAIPTIFYFLKKILHLHAGGRSIKEQDLTVINLMPFLVTLEASDLIILVRARADQVPLLAAFEARLLRTALFAVIFR
jgi:hypothetical protein